MALQNIGFFAIKEIPHFLFLIIQAIRESCLNDAATFRPLYSGILKLSNKNKK